MKRETRNEGIVRKVGCVSFLNSKPLIEPLVGRVGVEVSFAVPSKLMGLVESGEVEAALLSVVDYQLCGRELVLVPVGMIGCDGPTLTVRIFSRVPVGEIKVVHGDTDSHTSVILAQLILREAYGVKAELVAFEAHEGNHPAAGGGPETMLLIGDKVVNASPEEEEYPYQLDLGEEWKKLTGLPFVFAMWMMRRDGGEETDAGLAGILREGQELGARMTEALVEKYAEERGWPAELARRYFTEYLRYRVTDQARVGLARFFEMAGKAGLLDVKRPPAYLEIA